MGPLVLSVVIAPPDAERLVRTLLHDMRAELLLHHGAGPPLSMPVIFAPAPRDAPASEAERLTPAERQVVDALRAGRTLREIAEARGASLHTVRSQLKSAMSKLDVHRQSDLLRRT